MSWSKTFVELDKTKHDRRAFDCGEIELNTFLQKQAVRHMDAGVSKTLVLPTLNFPSNMPAVDLKYAICSFYTVAAATISREILPQSQAKKLPKYPVPVFLLAQLATDIQYHGQGLGKVSLINALQYLVRVNKHMPAYAIIVDCLNERSQSFYNKFGFEVLCLHNGRVRMYINMKTVIQLFD